MISNTLFNFIPLCIHAKSLQSCPTLCDPMDCSLSGSSVYGILQARILEWVAMSFSRGSSWPRDQACISYLSYIGRQVLYHEHHLGIPPIFCPFASGVLDAIKLLGFQSFLSTIPLLALLLYINNSFLSYSWSMLCLGDVHSTFQTLRGYILKELPKFIYQLFLTQSILTILLKT